MSKLHDLYYEYGQSPWLDNLRRGWLTGGELARWVERGVRGITSNPTIFQKAMASSDEYDDQFGDLVARGTDVDDAYWTMAVADIEDALRILRPVHDESGGVDGFVSLEVAPDLARDRDGTIAAARELHDRIAAPNLFVKVPATAEGVEAIRTLIGEGRSINVTLIFGLDRYAEVMEAYISGLEAFDGDLSHGGQRGQLLREPGRHRDRPAARGHRHARGPRPPGPGRGGPGPGGLQRLPGHVPGAALAGPGRAGRPGAAAAVGVDVDQEPRLPRHALRRRPDRPRHRQHDAGGDPGGVRGPRDPGPDRRRRPGRPPGRPSTPSPRSASTSTTWPGCWRTRASPASPRASTS